MAKSLIRKNQLHPDIADLISGYGNDFFITPDELNFVINSYQSGQNVVYTTGNQIIGDKKTFSSEVIAPNLVYNTGNQTVSGIKTFTSRPFFNGTGLATTGDIISASSNILQNGQDVVTFLNGVYFPYQPATITLAGYSLRELGVTFSNVPYEVTINQNQETSISNLELFSGNSVLRTIASPNLGTSTYYITPTTLSLNSSVNLSARVTIGNKGTPIGITSTQSVQFVAPNWHGEGANGINAVQSMRYSLNTRGSRVLTFNTVNNHFYYAYPDDWGLLTSIIDPSQFNIITSWSNRTANLILQDGVTSYTYRIYQSIYPSTNTSFIMTFNF
ncbi:MAG: hypothetical protein RL736_18 [Pseudomonadota bacterium]|jgi:hypothetical protein